MRYRGRHTPTQLMKMNRDQVPELMNTPIRESGYLWELILYRLFSAVEAIDDELSDLRDEIENLQQ